MLIALLFSDMSKPHREIKDFLCHIKEARIEQFKMSFLLDWSLNRFTFVNIWKKIREEKVGRIRYLYSILYSFSIFLAQLGLVIYFHPFASVVCPLPLSSSLPFHILIISSETTGHVRPPNLTGVVFVRCSTTILLGPCKHSRHG